MSVPERDFQRRVLSVKPATADALEGYGHIIAPARRIQDGNTPYYGEAVRTDSIPFTSTDDTGLTLATLNPRPMEVRWMEYHNKHTQTFVPIGAKPFVMVLGRPTCRRPDGSWDKAALQQPALDEVEAFYFDGSAGFVLNIGTWHEFPFPLERETNVVVILTHETSNNLRDNIKDGEAEGGDLCKRDLQKRFNIVFEVDPDSVAKQTVLEGLRA